MRMNVRACMHVWARTRNARARVCVCQERTAPQEEKPHVHTRALRIDSIFPRVCNVTQSPGHHHNTPPPPSVHSRRPRPRMANECECVGLYKRPIIIVNMRACEHACACVAPLTAELLQNDEKTRCTDSGYGTGVFALITSSSRVHVASFIFHRSITCAPKTLCYSCVCVYCLRTQCHNYYWHNWDTRCEIIVPVRRRLPLLTQCFMHYCNIIQSGALLHMCVYVFMRPECD